MALIILIKERNTINKKRTKKIPSCNQFGFERWRNELIKQKINYRTYI